MRRPARGSLIWASCIVERIVLILYPTAMLLGRLKQRTCGLIENRLFTQSVFAFPSRNVPAPSAQQTPFWRLRRATRKANRLSPWHELAVERVESHLQVYCIKCLLHPCAKDSNPAGRADSTDV